MSLIRSLGSLTIQTRSYIPARSLHPKKFVSILSDVPTKPTSAWQFYLTENINNFKGSNGKVDLKVATQQLSQQWKSMSEHEKKPFVNRYESDLKAHYEALNKVMTNTTSKQFVEENKLRKKYNLPQLRDPKRPKRPKGAFLLFVEELRTKKDPIVSSGPITEQMVKASEKFKNLSSGERDIINQKAAAELAEYKAAMQQYLNQLKA
ncbi:Transcription factor A, mitochondrial [Choanephora cucurbitarum]|uniref:Transcription factor A, mitochondrial n=1 Tax=Choanephora cucurbitarum TaxID=101091 RepID=A0A1C7NRE3_9FUNG|nr:Transcription factor A, mitochondrial [Choanephora cucurbitarum]